MIVVAFTTTTFVAAEVPNVTVAPARNCVPVIVTAVPPAELPVAGAINEVVGGGNWYVNPPESVVACVSAFVTVTSAEPGVPAGVTAVIEVALTKVTEVAATPPTVTVAPEEKPVPVIVIVVPPAEGPSAGETPVAVGAGAASTTRVSSTSSISANASPTANAVIVRERVEV